MSLKVEQHPDADVAKSHMLVEQSGSMKPFSKH
jgi:hypothetical protein